VQLALIEKQTEQINKKQFPYKSYTAKKFTKCTKQQLWQMLKPKINCTIAGYENVVPENFAYCDSLTAARATLKQIFYSTSEFVSNLSKLNCPLPCSHKSYKCNIKYYHINSWLGLDNSTSEVSKTAAIVSVTYISFLVEEQVEVYVYDPVNLMTSIGENLGLFLGFSCFSTFIALPKILFGKFI
jgi:hypothetical protein